MKTVVFNQRFYGMFILLGLFIFAGTAAAVISPSDNFPIPNGRYDSSNGTGYGNVQTEMISMSLTASPGVPPMSLPSPGQTTRVDSFFEIWTELSITGNDDGSGGTRTFDTEMISLSLAGGPSGWQIRESPSRPTYGLVTVLKLADNSYQVDSFFDIWTEISLDGGQSWSPADSSLHMELTTITPEPTSLMLLALGGMVLRMKKRSVC